MKPTPYLLLVVLKWTLLCTCVSRSKFISSFAFFYVLLSRPQRGGRPPRQPVGGARKPVSQSGAAPKNSKVIDSRSRGGGAGAGRRNVSAAGGGAKKGAPQSKKDKVREKHYYNLKI